MKFAYLYEYKISREKVMDSDILSLIFKIVLVAVD